MRPSEYYYNDSIKSVEWDRKELTQRIFDYYIENYHILANASIRYVLILGGFVTKHKI